MAIVKCDIVLFVLVVLGVAFDVTRAVSAVKYYASKYDHLDVEGILNNRRLVNYYSACLLNEGPCPPEGIEFKRILPEALQTNCGRCTEKQSTVALRVIKRLKKEYPKIWAQLMKRWDPNDIYVKKFESTFRARIVPGKSAVVEPVDTSRVDSVISQLTSKNVSSKSTTTRTTELPDTMASSTATIKTFSLSSAFDITIPAVANKSSTKIAIGTISNRPFGTSSSSIRPFTTSSPKFILMTKTTTKKPITRDPFETFLNNNPPVPLRPLSALGNNIGATVSGLVRGIGAIGTRVVETGVEVADVIFKNLARPLSA